MSVGTNCRNNYSRRDDHLTPLPLKGMRVNKNEKRILLHKDTFHIKEVNANDKILKQNQQMKLLK